MRTKQLLVPLILCVVVAFVACSGMPKPKPFQDMTAKEKASLALSTYNDAFEEYKYQYSLASIPMTEEQIDFFTGFKKSLTVAWQAINAYTPFVDGDMAPTPEAEQALLGALRGLQAYIGGNL